MDVGSTVTRQLDGGRQRCCPLPPLPLMLDA
jgi:hypothetical protein